MPPTVMATVREAGLGLCPVRWQSPEVEVEAGAGVQALGGIEAERSVERPALMIALPRAQRSAPLLLLLFFVSRFCL